MAADPFPLHHQSEALLAVDIARLFAHLDDHRRLASHMEKPSLMTAGASMHIDTDERLGPAVGSVIRMTGTLLGLRLSVEEVDYRLPTRGVGRVLGWLLGRVYAAWCTQRMVDDARAAFGKTGPRHGDG